MSRFHLISGLLFLALAAGCKAQTPTQPSNLSLNRHIEVMVRSQFNIPAEFDLQIGPRHSSQVPGYESFTITLVHGERKIPIEFLISSDNKTLARLETMDLSHDPAFNIDATGRPARGAESAPITIINFDDLACPYCARMHSTLFPATLEHYGDKVKVIYKDNPLVSLHPWAMHAAIDANCLAAQNGKAYWEFVDYIHGHGQEVNGDDRVLSKSFDTLNRLSRQFADQDKLDMHRLEICMTAQDESAIRASMAEAEGLKVDGAPALFINGEKINGAVPESTLWDSIDRALKAAGITPPARSSEAAKPPVPATGNHP